MYTIVPLHRHSNVSYPMNSLFDDRFFRSFFDMNDMVGAPGFRVDVKEEPESYSLEAELPGVKQEDISLSVDHGVLTISAEVNAQKKEKHENYLYSERRSGHMERRFSLDGIHEDGITAEYKDGILTVNLPKVKPEPEKSARRIAINGSVASEPIHIDGQNA